MPTRRYHIIVHDNEARGSEQIMAQLGTLSLYYLTNPSQTTHVIRFGALLLLLSMASNVDDLYGDLEDAVAKPMSISMRLPTITQPQVAQLRQQVQSLKAENDILKKNMGILYRTSKSELDRKDRTIAQLQEELDSLRR